MDAAVAGTSRQQPADAALQVDLGLGALELAAALIDHHIPREHSYLRIGIVDCIAAGHDFLAGIDAHIAVGLELKKLLLAGVIAAKIAGGGIALDLGVALDDVDVAMRHQSVAV